MRRRHLAYSVFKTTYRYIQTMADGIDLTTCIIKDHFMTIVYLVRSGLQKLVGAQLVYGYGNQGASHSNLPSTDASQKSNLIQRMIKDSFDEAIIPLGSDVVLRERYVNFHNKVRFGRMLEDLDTIAVHIGYKHNEPQLMTSSGGTEAYHPLAIVTAAVDRIEVDVAHMDIDRDIRLSGFASYVGKSSMEVKLKIDQNHDGQWKHVLHALFVLAARDPKTKNSAPMNPLIASNDEEKKIIDQGRINRDRRLTESAKSLFKMAPDPTESSLVHELFLKTITPNTSIFRTNPLPENSIWMEDTHLQNVLICHPENGYDHFLNNSKTKRDRDLRANIGYRPRSTLCKQPIGILAVDDIMFQKPVEIGSLLFLSSMVVYVTDSRIQTRVHAEVVDSETGNRQTTNVFYFVFSTTDHKQLPSVVPKSYAEAIMYIDGKRHID
ncbi:unnamed protein product [Didymodactylos carnosus]|uniref:HotDog ACOT-type domain-containing protein n=1 Tax=Didymodactylos carnosus TaxID=1234261 RepID=A0A814C4F3_9BILA|nr:unnamed protein product [Didymodactylos carnosus]CAF3712503.1 unnamed protein product [Didymodactylos carnosus]